MKYFAVSALTCILSAAPVLAQTAPPQANGYQLAWSENFSDFDISPNGYGLHNWYPGIYFQPTQSYAGPIAVNQSGLDLQWDRSSGENNTSMEGCSFDASHCNTFRYGYFEARMKWDVTTGAWPAFWLITKQGIEGIQHVGELDIFEGQGSDPTHYYGTINEWNGPSDLVSTNSPAANRFTLPGNNDYSQWHTYGVLWVPGTVTWYYDNQAVGTAAAPAIFDQQDFFIVLGSYEGNNWTFGNLNGVTAQTMNLDVQWVHVFQTSATTATAARISPTSSIVPASVTSGVATLQSALPASQNLAITLELPLRNEAGLETLLQQISNPQSSAYRQFLTAAQFTANYAPTQTDYDSVVAWAQSKGLTVSGTTANRETINVSGTVSLINQAFDITMDTYLDPTKNQQFFAPNQEPSLDLSVQLLGISGLTQSLTPLGPTTVVKKFTCGVCRQTRLAR